MQNQIPSHFTEALEVLKNFIANPANFQRITEAGNLMAEAVRGGNRLFSCGNGGSFCDAMHFAEELTGRYRGDRKPIPAIAISDASHITCVGNDYGFDHIFARYLAAHGQPGDVLLAISTSGNSANVLNAAITAREKGMTVVGLTGKDGGKLAGMCTVEIRAPLSEFADRAQEIHIKVIHALIDHIEKNC
jgi:D-sedoheptulose 7-phosphate isomerase